MLEFGTGQRIRVTNHETHQSIEVLDVPDHLLVTTMHVLTPDIMSDRWLQYFLKPYEPEKDDGDKELTNNRAKAALFMQEMLERRNPKEPKAEFYLQRIVQAYNLLRYSKLYGKEVLTAEMSDEEMKEYRRLQGHNNS